MAVKKRAAAKKEKGHLKYLVIVESPAKSKTINKILGADCKVIASMGHVIDLPSDRMGIDFKNDFKPEYMVMKGRTKNLQEIKKEAKNADAVYLAADPDREGEAICWHLSNYLKDSGCEMFRVRFEEITPKAVKDAFDNPGHLDMNKVNAQQARRLLDRIVGYSLSPLLWRLISRGLSAGRVQSVSVRLIVEREEEIRKFVPVEYWSLEAVLKKEEPVAPPVRPEFRAKLVKHKGEKIHVTKKLEMDAVLDYLKDKKFIVSEIIRKEKKSYPRAPFTTSVLQQEGFNKLNFSASKTMRVAQRLYEGVELGEEGSVGLITYMRTDSVRISDDASEEAKKYILDKYGKDYYPDKKTVYKSKRSAQEAHEAIRPTLPLRSPGEVMSFLAPDELKLYSLIWKRFVSSQMTSAVYSLLSVHINASDYDFRAGGSEILFDGYLRIYREQGENIDTELAEIPPLRVGEEVSLLELIPDQHFTKPPARYSDASLVKELEEKGIGRPSTYAPIIRTIIDRNYVRRIQKYFQPTELGEMVNEFLMANFHEIVDYEFTAKMEGDLDEIESGNKEWLNIVRYFYEPFALKLVDAQAHVKEVKKKNVESDQKCDLCGKTMVVKWGRRGQFLSCSAFPNCRFSKSITTGVKCPVEGCSGELIERKSKRGSFFGCVNFPKCTYIAKVLPGKKVEETSDDTVEDE